MASLPAPLRASRGVGVHPTLPLQRTPLWCLSAGTATAGSGERLCLVAIVGGSGSQESKTGVGLDQIALCSVDAASGALRTRAALQLECFPDSVFLSPDCEFALVTTFNTVRAYRVSGAGAGGIAAARNFDSIVPAGRPVITEDEAALKTTSKRCKVAFIGSGGGGSSPYDFVTAGVGGAVRRWTIRADAGAAGGAAIVPLDAGGVGGDGEFLNAASARVFRDLEEIAQLKRRLEGGPDALTAQWTQALSQEASFFFAGEN